MGVVREKAVSRQRSAVSGEKAEGCRLSAVGGQPPSWAGAYIGIPFVARGRDRAADGGLDCYGLVRTVLAERAGIHLPLYGTCGQTRDKVRQAAAIAVGRDAGKWRRVTAGTERAFDVAAIEEIYKDRFGMFQSAALHLGVVVAPGWILHTKADTDARCARYDPALPRGIEFFRMEEAVSRQPSAVSKDGGALKAES